MKIILAYSAYFCVFCIFFSYCAYCAYCAFFAYYIFIGKLLHIFCKLWIFCILLAHFLADETDKESNVKNDTAKADGKFDTGDYIIPPNIARPVFYVSNLMLLQVRRA